MKPRKVLIVGGGSSGWMTAAYLNAALNRPGRQVAEISLVESPDVPIIGVGEATIPSINHILSVIGVDLIEFMKATDATFKQSIKFSNWLHNQGESYHHSFQRFREAPIDHTGADWFNSDRSIPFMETVSIQPKICEMNLSPMMMGPWDFGAPLKYAFHMDATKFAHFLQQHSTARGVSHYLDHVDEVLVKDNGNIQAVKCQSGQVLEADLFIDCTGFAALLIEKAMGVKFVDVSQWLLCDQALTMKIPYEHYYPGTVKPYTTATALSSGWIWDIGLQNRRAVGYVHASDFISRDEAEAELRTYEGDHSHDLDTRLVKFKVGYRERAWVGNCVAIGLSAGFIEPLESTGLYLSDLAAVMLREYFPMSDDMEQLAYRYNRIIYNRFHEILDFINLHYCLTKRQDSEFWREVQKSERITERLKAKLEFWQHKAPTDTDFEDQHFPTTPNSGAQRPEGFSDIRQPVDTGNIFPATSYEAIMFGMDFMGDEMAQRHGNSRHHTQVHPNVARRLQAAPSKLPPHDVWLKQILNMQHYN